jgi:hypothetical protein
MKLTLALLAPLALTVLGGAASAQDSPTIDVGETHALPTGIPGTLDPATGRFTPSVPEPSGIFPPQSGEIVVSPSFRFNSSIHEFDTVFCTVTAEFGDGSIFDHSTRVQVGFTAGIPDSEIDLPYTYTPNTTFVLIKVNIRCTAINSSGAKYSSEDNQTLLLDGGKHWLADLYL